MIDDEKGARRRAALSPMRARLNLRDGADDGWGPEDPGPQLRRRRRPLEARRLFTATVALGFESHVMIVFHASMARNTREVRRRLCGRLGEVGAGLARITEGYDELNFIARTVVTPGLRELLRVVENAPDGRTADRFDVQHVQFVGVEP